MASIVYLIIGIVLITIIGCITLLLLNLYMRKPINEIQVALKNISKGNFNYRIEYKTKSDLQELIDGINSMSEMLNTYIDEKYLQEIRVKDAKFKTFGCGGAISSSSLMTEKIIGKTIEDALKITNKELVEELELPKLKVHCSVMAEEPIAKAIENYREKNNRTNKK